MKKIQTGLRTVLYTFPLSAREKYNATRSKLQNKGTVTTVFVSNGFGFEFTRSVSPGLCR